MLAIEKLVNSKMTEYELEEDKIVKILEGLSKTLLSVVRVFNFG